MAEVTTTSSATPEQGQSPSTSVETSPAPSAPEQAAAQETPKVNLFELPDFKAYQAQASRREAQLRDQFAATQQRLRELETKDLDEVGQAQYRVRELEGRLRQQEQAAYDAQMQMQAHNDAQRISNLTGMPVKDILEKAQNLDNAWELATKFMVKQLEQTYRQQGAAKTEKAERNSVHVGAGSSAAGDSTPFDAAMTARDPVAYIRALRQQNNQG